MAIESYLRFTFLYRKSYDLHEPHPWVTIPKRMCEFTVFDGDKRIGDLHIKTEHCTFRPMGKEGKIRHPRPEQLPERFTLTVKPSKKKKK